jgi:hypothetical protein
MGHPFPVFAAALGLAAAIAFEARRIADRIRGYVPHRQICPFIADRICVSVGCGVLNNNSAPLMICPL